MTFLELVQRLHQLSGASGSEPTSVLNQRGEAARLVNWVGDADYNLQARWLNWKFLHARTGSNFTLEERDKTAAPGDLKSWDVNTFFIRERTEDYWQRMEPVEYEIWIQEQSPDTDTGFPAFVIVNPDNSLSFDVIPDAQYQFRADYYKKPVRMAADGDVSPVPEEYHPNVILGDALMFYADFDDANELRNRAQMLISGYRGQLEADQLPGQSAMWRMGAGLSVEPR